MCAQLAGASRAGEALENVRNQGVGPASPRSRCAGSGDTLVVTKLDRLVRSLPDARAIADELTAQQVQLSLGGSVYDPNDAVGRLLFNVLAMVAEFEADSSDWGPRRG